MNGDTTEAQEGEELHPRANPHKSGTQDSEAQELDLLKPES